MNTLAEAIKCKETLIFFETSTISWPDIRCMDPHQLTTQLVSKGAMLIAVSLKVEYDW